MGPLRLQVQLAALPLLLELQGDPAHWCLKEEQNYSHINIS